MMKHKYLFLILILCPSVLNAQLITEFQPRYRIEYQQYSSWLQLHQQINVPLRIRQNWMVAAVSEQNGEQDTVLDKEVITHRDSLDILYTHRTPLRFSMAMTRYKVTDENNARQNITQKYYLRVGIDWRPIKLLTIYNSGGWISDEFETNPKTDTEWGRYIQNKGVELTNETRFKYRTKHHAFHLSTENWWQKRTHTVDHEIGTNLDYRLNAQKTILPDGHVTFHIQKSKIDRLRSTDDTEEEQTSRGGGTITIERQLTTRFWLQFQLKGSSQKTTRQVEIDSTQTENEQTRQFLSHLRYQMTSRVQIDTKIRRELIDRDDQQLEDIDVRYWWIGVKYRFSPHTYLQLNRQIRLQQYTYHDPESQRQNRDILDHDTFFEVTIPFSKITRLKLDFNIQERHYIYLKAATSANSRKSTIYSLAPDLTFFVHPNLSFRQNFRLTADHIVYDFDSNRDHLYRRLISSTHLTQYFHQTRQDSIGIVYEIDVRNQGEFHTLLLFFTKTMAQERLILSPQFKVEYTPFLQRHPSTRFIRRETRWHMLYRLHNRLNLMVDARWREEKNRDDFWDTHVRLVYQP